MVEQFVPEAVFSDGTAEFREPAEPKAGETVKIRIRTFRDGVDSMELCIDGKLFPMIHICQSRNGMMDVYQAEYKLGEERVSYYFKMTRNETVYYYNRIGVVDNPDSRYDFEITPGFSTPEWAKGAVFYQIFVDRFCNGDPNNDVLDDEYCYIGQHVSHVDSWNRYPQSMDVREFYGGDLAGVLQKLDYLADLGVEVLYLNPIFTSPSNHKYDAQDYDNIDPHYGVIATRRGSVLAPDDNNNSHATSYIDAVTSEENCRLSNELFIKLVEEVHKRGMKIILDGVFNHCGSFNKWIDREGIYEQCLDFPKGAYVSEDSRYRKYFTFKKEDAWPYNDSYSGWWGHDTLPKLNYEGSEELYRYIMNIGRKWVSPPYNCDGWRLDVAADLGHTSEFNHKFWADFRKNVKEANPEAIILAEHYGDPHEWLRGDQWDTVMNYDAFMEPVTWFFTGMEKHSDAFVPEMLNNGNSFSNALIYNMTRYQTPSLHVAMNELSNHDHSRFLTRTNHVVGRTSTMGPEAAEKDVNMGVFREAVVFQMTWPGAPTVYYGDEAGVCGWTDPDNRRTFPWGHENKECICFHKEMINIHKSYDALRSGSVKILFARKGIIAYGRFKGNEIFTVVFNNNEDEQEVTLPVWELGISNHELMVRLIYTNSEFYGLDAKLYTVVKGYVSLKMPKQSAIVLKNIPTEIQDR
ncbi:MAG: glycoside hydrolase family 13 protein [Lachnospiraceae bacterium]